MEEKKTPQEVIEILKEIGKKTGYDFHFEDVSIDLAGNKFTITDKKQTNYESKTT